MSNCVVKLRKFEPHVLEYVKNLKKSLSGTIIRSAFADEMRIRRRTIKRMHARQKGLSYSRSGYDRYSDTWRSLGAQVKGMNEEIITSIRELRAIRVMLGTIATAIAEDNP